MPKCSIFGDFGIKKSLPGGEALERWLAGADRACTEQSARGRARRGGSAPGRNPLFRVLDATDGIARLIIGVGNAEAAVLIGFGEGSHHAEELDVAGLGDLGSGGTHVIAHSDDSDIRSVRGSGGSGEGVILACARRAGDVDEPGSDMIPTSGIKVRHLGALIVGVIVRGPRIDKVRGLIRSFYAVAYESEELGPGRDVPALRADSLSPLKRGEIFTVHLSAEGGVGIVEETVAGNRSLIRGSSRSTCNYRIPYSIGRVSRIGADLHTLWHIAEVAYHPGPSVAHLLDVVAYSVIDEVILVLVELDGGVFTEISAVIPIDNIAREGDDKVSRIDDHVDGVAVARLDFGGKDSLGHILAAGVDGDGEGCGLRHYNGLPGGIRGLASRNLGGRSGRVGGGVEVGVKVCGKDGPRNLHGRKVIACIILDIEDNSGELVLEGYGHGVGRRLDIAGASGDEVGRRNSGALVSLYAERGRDSGALIWVIGFQGRCLSAFFVPHRRAGEDGSVVREERVVGINSGFAGDGETDLVSALEVRGRRPRHDRHDGDGNINKSCAIVDDRPFAVVAAGEHCGRGKNCKDFFIHHNIKCC